MTFPIERRKHVRCTETSAAVVKSIQSAGAPDQPEDPDPDVSSALKRRTVKHMLCAAGVRNVSAEAVHLHTALHELIS